jgi:hypothetical protein
MRTDENSILYGNAMINRNIILDFNIVPDNDSGIYVHAFSQNAVLPQTGVFANLAMMPYTGALTEDGFLRYFGGWMNTDGHGMTSLDLKWNILYY